MSEVNRGTIWNEMRILVFESNLMWSSKLARTIRALGHEPVVLTSPPETIDDGCVAIINLAQSDPAPATLTKHLQSLGVKVIGHAGHKEKDLLELGRAAGVEILATNSELTFKLPDILARLSKQPDC